MKRAVSPDKDRDNTPSPGDKRTPPSAPKTCAERIDRVLTAIGYIFGVFTLAVFGAYFVKITIFPEGTLPLVACLLVFAGLALPLLLRRQLRRWLKKLFLPAKAIYVLVIAAFSVSFIAMCVYLLAPRAETPYEDLPDAPVVVVFGAKVKETGAPGTPLARRLYKAKEILDARPDAICIASGGKGDDEPISEAESMKRWLVSAGIDESRVILEDRSHNTIENIKFSRELIEQNDLADSAVVCVSSDFHVDRIRFISERTGGFGDYYYRAGGLRKWDWEYFGLVREYLSFGRIILLGAD